MSEISRDELETMLAALGTGGGLGLRPRLEVLAPSIVPDLRRLLEDEGFREYLWQSHGKAQEGQKPQVEIMGVVVNAFEPISRETFSSGLQSWAMALLMPLPEAQQEPLCSLIHGSHRARRREALETVYNTKTGLTERRPATEKQNRWWSFLEACEDGDLEKVQAAVGAGVLGEHEDAASSGLFSALCGGGSAATRTVAAYLLENGANIETEANANTGTGLLHAACCNGDLETVRFLLEHGAKVDGIKFSAEDGPEDDDNYCGLDETPLICAAMDGHLEIMQVLIEAGANVNAWCDSHGSALDCAKPEVAELLQQHGATYHYGPQT